MMLGLEPDIRIFADAKILSRRAAEVILQQITAGLQTKKHFTLALCGGTTPKLLYALLAADDSFNSRVPWHRVHFFWGDERIVPPDHPESNYRTAANTLLCKVPVPPANIHRMKTEEPDPFKAAQDYEQELRIFFRLETGQLPRFDCVLLGMGSDGHTASLFPGTAALRHADRLVVANWVEQFETYRITLTAPVLNNADWIIFLVSGAQKAEALQQVLEGNKQPERYPAQLIRPTHGKLLWLVDQAAASRLNFSSIHSVKHLKSDAAFK